MQKTATIIVCCLGLLILLGFLGPQVHSQIAFNSFQALMSKDDMRNPATVEIIADGKRATFHKHTETYGKLLRILQNRHSEDACHQAKRTPRFDEQRLRYGEIVVHRYCFRSHFKFHRSATNGNIFWVGVPHKDGTGTHWPRFALGSDFVDLVDSVSSKEAAEPGGTPNTHSPSAQGVGGR